MESTQMPINDILDKENVVHIHHGILFIHRKDRDYFLCSDTDGAGSHYPQQTNTGTENQMYKWKMNNENTWTHGGEQHILGPVVGCGTEVGRALGRIDNGFWASPR